MPEAVFNDTPLAEYLSDAGIEDWGIEDSFVAVEGAPGLGALDPNQPQVSASGLMASPGDSALEPAHNSLGLLPLLLGPQSTHLQAQRFRSVVRTALNPRLAPQETAKFLEQFHYAIVSSQLLEARPLYTSWSALPDQQRQELLFSAAGPWDAVRLKAKFWVGGGGCIFAIATLLAWRIKRGRADPTAELGSLPALYEQLANTVDGDNAQATATGTRGSVRHPLPLATLQSMALVVTLCVGLYLYAHSRRRLLRLLRAKALGHVDEFVAANKAFDGDVVRALRSLQQTELLDQGLHPAFTATRNALGIQDVNASTVRAGKKLRAVLASALHLGIEALLDAIKDCVGMCSELDLQQYMEVYDLPSTQKELHFVMNGDFVGFVDSNSTQVQDFYGAAACYTPLPTLKHQFRKLHFLRRALLCCLLSVRSAGESSTPELESWTIVTDHLKLSAGLMAQLSQMIVKERFNPERSTETTGEQHAAPQRTATGLLELSIVAQHVAARLDIVSSAALDADEHARHQAQLRTEIKHMNELWATLGGPSTPSGPDPSAVADAAGPRAVLSPHVDDAAFVSGRSHRWSAISMVSGDSSLTLREDTPYLPTPDSSAAELSPALDDSGVAKFSRPRSTLTREERISAAKARSTVFTSVNGKAAAEATRQQYGTSDIFMAELNAVLDRRNARA